MPKPIVNFFDLTSHPYSELPSPPSSTVLCLGNFDGVHSAHTALLRKGLQLKRQHNRVFPSLCGAFVFYRPTWDYFKSNETSYGYLTSLDEKLRLFAEHGLDFVALCRFEDVCDLSADDFLDLLYQRCNCRAIVCGYNYTFGKAAQGTPDLIEKHFKDYDDFCLAVIPKITAENVDVSSSEIRNLIKHGEVDAAAKLLGRNYSIEGAVIHGKELGRKLGFPTANQTFPKGKLVPAHGVYITACYTEHGFFEGISNVGLRPTVDDPNLSQVNCESHLIGLSNSIYGQNIRVEFLKYLRGEIKFANVEELRAAIQSDLLKAKEYFKINNAVQK